jgi:flagella basal body P-ring formation protein FlgA
MAEPMESHQSIRAAAESFIAAEVLASYDVMPTVEAGRLDSRLKLAPCDQPLETNLPPGGRMLGNAIVGVRCSGTKPWNIYVPVKVSLYESVVVTASPMSSGQVISAGDVKLIERDVTRLHSGYFSGTTDVVGKKVKRSLPLGAVITRTMLREAIAIKRGQRISLVSGSGGLQVRMTGVAMADGAAGDRIEVRNLSSKRVIEGVVLSSADVQVGM